MLLAGVVAAPAVRRVVAGADGPDLIDVLGRTARTQMVAGVLLAVGLVLSA
jgi:1,4-dihydroxy-2-naphthoate octaprenyltransferase